MSNTNDLIRRGDAIDAVYSRIKQIGYENNVNVLSIRQAVREVPTAQPEQKKGKWIAHPNKEFKEWDVCTACGVGCKRREYEGGGMTEYNYLYCPNCGADMRGE